MGEIRCNSRWLINVKKSQVLWRGLSCVPHADRLFDLCMP